MKMTDSSKVFALSVVFILLPISGIGFWYILDINPFRPIYIIGDENLAKFSSRGTGTNIDPYILDGITINTYHKGGLSIINTESFFIIQQCKIQSSGYGIRLLNIRNNTAVIQYNTLIDCSIWLYCSNGVDILNNSISGLGGLKIERSSSLRVYNNHFGEYGISFEINEDPYYVKCQPIVPFILDDYSNNTVANLEIVFCLNYSNFIFNQQYGQIFLLKCSNITIINQKMKNVKMGIYAYQTNNFTIANCEFKKCYNAIYVNGTTSFYFYNNSIINYELYSPTSLKVVESSNGIIFNNSFGGTEISTCIDFDTSENITLTRNFLQGSICGLDFLYCENITVMKNQIEDFYYYAVSVYSSIGLIFYENNFINNSFTASQALEYSSINIKWYNVILSTGNFWSDWSGIGSYQIEGGNHDNFPLTIPVNIYA